MKDLERFPIRVPDDVLHDLARRVEATRWPPPAPGEPWELGANLDQIRRLVSYWVDGFDWRLQERWLNGYPHFRAEVDGLLVHFVHREAATGAGLPLILTHGWPSCFVEYLPLVDLLTDPRRHGIDGPAFDVVVPSLPGYGFSARPTDRAVTTRHTAGLWHELMRGLGYPRFGAGGGDFGAAVSTFLALDHPDSVVGLHLSNLELAPYTGPGARPLSPAERDYVDANARWARDDRGYGVIQETRPQTVAYALTDSPAGLAAWILEKWRAWADSGGDLESRFSRDLLLTVLTLYWATGTIATSVRDYVDNRRTADAIGPDTHVRVPTAVAVFAHQYLDDGTPPREWAERLYDIVRWTPMPRGGHFAPTEEPGLLARDIAAFFGSL